MSAKIIKTVKCPTCAKPAVWNKEKNPARPFCNDRCRLIDLGAWADESHRIADATPPDFDPDGSSNQDR